MKIYKSRPKGQICPSMPSNVWQVGKIKWHQIINHQLCNPGHPNPLLNHTHISKMYLSNEEVWWHLSAEKCGPSWMAPRMLHWRIIIKIVNRSSSRRASHIAPWRFITLIQNRNMPQYDTRCMIGQKSGDMKSSIIKCAISVIQIKPKHLWNVSQNNKHDDNQMPKKCGSGWIDPERLHWRIMIK